MPDVYACPWQVLTTSNFYSYVWLTLKQRTSLTGGWSQPTTKTSKGASGSDTWGRVEGGIAPVKGVCGISRIMQMRPPFLPHPSRTLIKVISFELAFIHTTHCSNQMIKHQQMERFSHLILMLHLQCMLMICYYAVFSSLTRPVYNECQLSSVRKWLGLAIAIVQGNSPILMPTVEVVNHNVHIILKILTSSW